MKERFYSLDVFRGATVALMILVNNPGSWSHIYAPLEHAAWHGCTPTDLVFPFFLFAVGNALAFVMPKMEEKGTGYFLKKVCKRSLLIFIIGLALNWFPFIKYDADGSIVAKGFDQLRIMGVLQRIALAYLFASLLIYFLKLQWAFVAGFFILLLYWFLCVALNPADPFSLAGWFGTRVDMAVFGANHMYHGEGVAFDPEGLMSTMGAIVQVIFGYIAGHYIIHKGKNHEMLNGLFVAGCVLIFSGFCWDMVFPINKKIWSSSYVIYTTGLALLIISVMIYQVEFKNARQGWSRFFNVFGKNPLFIFALSAIVVKAFALIRTPIIQNGEPGYTTPLSWFYNHICVPLFENEKNASLLYALCFITLMWFIAWVLHRKKIYIKV